MKFSQLFLNSLLALVIFLDLIHVMFSRRSNSVEKCLEKLSKTNLKLNFLKISLPALYRKHRKILSALNLKNCQTQSYSLYRLANRFGIKPQLIIGINNTNKFSSHAWLEHEGVKYYFDEEVKFNIIHKI